MPMLIDVAELAGLVAEACLYGIFITLSIVAAYGFSRGRKSSSPGPRSQPWPMAVAGILLVMLITTRLCIDTANVFVAFVRQPTRHARIEYLTDVKQPLFIIKHSILIGVLFVGDSFVNWRCWVVWGKKIWIVALPVIMSISSTVAGSYTMWAYAHVPSQEILSGIKWMATFYVLSLVANATSTSLLAYRICIARKETSLFQASTTTNPDGTQTPDPGHRSLKPILKIILESGALNAAYLLAYTLCLVTKTQGLEVMSEMACPLTGIIFVIVIIRVGLHSNPEAYCSSPRSEPGNTNDDESHTTATQPHVIFVGPTQRSGPQKTSRDFTDLNVDAADDLRRRDPELGTFRITEGDSSIDEKDW